MSCSGMRTREKLVKNYHNDASFKYSFVPCLRSICSLFVSGKANCALGRNSVESIDMPNSISHAILVIVSRYRFVTRFA